MVFVNGGTNRIGIRTSTPTASIYVGGSDDLISTNTSATQIAVQSSPTFTATGATGTRYPRAFAMSLDYDSTTSLAAGFFMAASYMVRISNTGAAGIRVADFINVNNEAGATIGSSHAVHIRNSINSGGGEITTQDGLYIENMTAGAGNFAIRTLGGKVQLVDHTTGNRTVLISKNIASATQPVCEIRQDHTDGATPCLELDQDDISEGFIDFVGSDRGAVATSTGNSVASFRVEMNGTKYVVPCFTDQ